ncbi:MAG: beta-lactamase family protein [Deltaproteobacteria bacterium]|nr:beta-lactamase family protein [Deltaproteobacteria bacterium]
MPLPEHFASSPESVGVDPEKVAALFDRAERDVREGRLPSAQVAVAREGKIAALRSFGAVTHEGRPAPATDQTLYVIFSCTKAITSAAAWLLLGEGKLRLDEPVAAVIPEFASNGKGAVTLEQLLTHTAGFPQAPLDPRKVGWSQLAERFATWRLNWEPGSRFEYHASSSMWVVAALVQARSGSDFRDFVRARIAEPLGLPDLRVGCPHAEQARLADVTHIGRAWTNEELIAKGFPPLPVTEVTEENLQRFNDPAVRELGVPGGGGTATAADLALFYQALVHDGVAADGTRVWQAETLRDARTIRNPAFLDPMFRKPANRGLGLVVAGGPDKVFLGFGRTGSDEMFGHLGAGGQIAWADPRTGLSFAYLTNGHDRDLLREGRRTVALSSLAAVCAL